MNYVIEVDGEVLAQDLVVVHVPGGVDSQSPEDVARLCTLPDASPASLGRELASSFTPPDGNRVYRKGDTD